MTYAFVQELPFTQDVYQRFLAALDGDPPDGLVVWVGEKVGESVRLTQVWDSEDAYERFAKGRLSSVTQDGFFASTEYAPPETEPARQPVTIYNVWTGVGLANPWPASGTVAGR
jgi:hypothetical protein